MKTFEKFISGLKKDIDIPDRVDRRFEDTLQGLEPGRKSHHWMKAAAVAAAFVILFGTVMVSNPALASNLPFVENIFEKVEKKVIYSGEYSREKTLKMDNEEKFVYSAEDQGIKFTVSEVYSDGFSVFATMKMESPKYDFRKAGLTRDGRQSINLATSYGINCDAGPYDYDLLLDGKNEGKNAFIGMVKFDKEAVSAENGVVNIAIKNIMITLEGQEDEEFVDGNWEFSLPFKTDQENSREISVNKKISDGLTIEKLFISPYQLVVFSDVGDCRPYADMTDEEISDALRGMKDAEVIEEVRNFVDKEYYEYAIFDQDGKVIPFERVSGIESEGGTDIYALQGRNVSQVHIYITQKEKNMSKMHQAETERMAKKLSEQDFVIDIAEPF